MSRSLIAGLLWTGSLALAAGCGGGGGTADSGVADTGAVDSARPDTAVMMDSSTPDAEMDSGTPAPRSTSFVTTSGGGAMSGGGYQLRLTVGVTPAGHSTGPASDLSLGTQAVLR